MEVFAILSLTLLVLMLIIINGHISPTPTDPLASPFSSPKAGKDTKSSRLLTEILPNSSTIWSACQSYFNDSTYGEYLMNGADWAGLIRCVHRAQNVWRPQQTGERFCFVADIFNLRCQADVAEYALKVVATDWHAEGPGFDPRRSRFPARPLPLLPVPARSASLLCFCWSVYVHLFLHLGPVTTTTPPPTAPCWHPGDCGYWFHCILGLLMRRCFPPGADVWDGKEHCHISSPPSDKRRAETKRPL